jgi:hypothetical protein
VTFAMTCVCPPFIEGVRFEADSEIAIGSDAKIGWACAATVPEYI